MDRRPLTMPAILLGATPRSEATRVARNPRASNSRRRNRPGWIAGAIVILCDSRRSRHHRHRHPENRSLVASVHSRSCPLPVPAGGELVKSNAFERTPEGSWQRSAPAADRLPCHDQGRETGSSAYPPKSSEKRSCAKSVSWLRKVMIVWAECLSHAETGRRGRGR